MHTEKTPTAAGRKEESTITISYIHTLVSSEFDVPYESLLQRTRKREVVLPRQITMYLANFFCVKDSQKTIGDYFGKDRGTVYMACNLIKGLLPTDDVLKKRVVRLIKKIALEL